MKTQAVESYVFSLLNTSFPGRSSGPITRETDLVTDLDADSMVMVSLICVTLVSFLEFGSTNPAAAAKPTVLASEHPVRVILPFTPNTAPGQR